MMTITGARMSLEPRPTGSSRAHNPKRGRWVEVPRPCPYNPDTSLDLRQARLHLAGDYGDHPHLEVVRRWAAENWGCRIGGRAGFRILLPTVRIKGRGRWGWEARTMAEWCRAFEDVRWGRLSVT